jgi:hypothetical protein
MIKAGKGANTRKKNIGSLNPFILSLQYAKIKNCYLVGPEEPGFSKLARGRVVSRDQEANKKWGQKIGRWPGAAS